MQKIYWLVQVSPSPGVGAGGGGQSLFDLKDYVTGIAVGLTVALILAIWAAAKQRAKIGRFFRRIGRFFQRIGAFFADRWERLNTPLDIRGPRATSPTAKTGVEHLEAIREQQESADLKVIATKQQLRLPARWTVKPDLRELGAMTLENLGPGGAHHVIVDASISGAAIRPGYWEEFPSRSEHAFRVDPPEWVGNEELYFILQWRNDEGEEKTAHLDAPVFFH